MSSSQFCQTQPVLPLINESQAWYAIHTYPRHERVVAERIRQLQIATFLPTIAETHRWSDRRKIVEIPLFSSYVFVQLVPTNETRLRVLRTEGVIGFVGSQRTGTPIPDEQIEAVRVLLDRKVACKTHPFLKVGQRVRVRGGALDGVEGLFVSQNGDESIVISVDAIQRSLAIRINGYDLAVA
jgi:transcription termination/antitermination protein NusG